MKEIHVKTIRHKLQRYETCGDYFERKGVMEFRISQLRNSDYEFLIALHELIEWYLTHRAGIPIREIDDFDKNFEEERARGLHSQDAEPGNSPKAPYGWAHRFATKIEKQLAKKLGVRWDVYESALYKLYR